MRLDLNKLEVESFSTGAITPTPTPVTVDTGPQGPDSICWICYETGNTVPSCAEDCTFFAPCPLPDTPFPPCPVIA